MDLVVKDYYGEVVTPGNKFVNVQFENPEISFISYDHEIKS